ncbi:hypothetical protein [Dyadobacter aurulentus]|uniref:hypothetical protein n=1 Tax=Dyadobacter sp. UC 10 TaxID=2605428 RepID=UPI001788A7C1|nr:hypothetical protein [Dyadobacter sp. UC 10]
MKTKELNTGIKLPKGFKISPELDGKYDGQPLFKEKAAKAKEMIRIAGLPD